LVDERLDRGVALLLAAVVNGGDIDCWLDNVLMEPNIQTDVAGTYDIVLYGGSNR